MVYTNKYTARRRIREIFASARKSNLELFIAWQSYKNNPSEEKLQHIKHLQKFVGATATSLSSNGVGTFIFEDDEMNLWRMCESIKSAVNEDSVKNWGRVNLVLGNDVWGKYHTSKFLQEKKPGEIPNWAEFEEFYE